MASQDTLVAFTEKCLRDEPGHTGISGAQVTTWPRLTEDLTPDERALVPMAGAPDNVLALARVLDGVPYGNAGLTGEQTSEFLTDMLYMMWMSRFNRYDSTDVLRTQSTPGIDQNTAVLPLHLGRLALAAGPSMDCWKLSDAVARKYAFLSRWPAPNSGRIHYWSSGFQRLVGGEFPMVKSLRNPGARALWCAKQFWGPLNDRPCGASEVLLDESKQRLRMATQAQLSRVQDEAEATRRAEARKLKQRLAVAGVLMALTVAGTTAVVVSRRRRGRTSTRPEANRHPSSLPWSALHRAGPSGLP